MIGVNLYDCDLDHEYMFEFYNQIADKSVLTDEDFKSVETHLQRVSEAERDRFVNRNGKKFEEEKMVFTFLDNLHLSYCANQMLLNDSNGDKLGNKYMKRAEILLPLINSCHENDHVLHVKLKYIIIKTRQLMLQQDDNSQKSIKKLYLAWKRISRNCDNKSIYCFSTNLYFETVYLAVLIRFGEVELRNKLISELQMMFDNYPQHKDVPFVKNQLILFYQQNMEITSAQNDVTKTDFFSEQILKLSSDEVRRATALERQTVVRLNTPQSYLTTKEVQFIENIQKRVDEKWKKLQESKTTASKHHRLFVFKIHAKYHQFSQSTTEKDEEKYGEELIELFEEKCSGVVVGSMDFANLDIAATYLEVCFKLKKFEKVSTFCNLFQKRKQKLNFPFDFKQLLNVIQLTASLGGSDATKRENCASAWPNIEYLKRAMNILAQGTNYRKIFWYNASLKFQYDFHKEIGSPEKFHQFRLESNFYLPSLYDKCCLIDTGSGKSSTTSITEIVEVKIRSIFFVYLESIVIPQLDFELVSKVLHKSYERWKDILIARLRISEDQIIGHRFRNRVVDFDNILTKCNGSAQPSYVIMLQQIVDSSNMDKCLSQDAVINYLSIVLSGREPVMLWIVMETVVIGCSPNDSRSDVGSDFDTDNVMATTNYGHSSSQHEDSNGDSNEKVNAIQYHNALNCHLTFSAANILSPNQLQNKKTLLDCLKESFEKKCGKKFIELCEVINEMSSNLALSPRDYICTQFECSDLNSKTFHLIY